MLDNLAGPDYNPLKDLNCSWGFPDKTAVMPGDRSFTRAHEFQLAFLMTSPMDFGLA